MTDEAEFWRAVEKANREEQFWNIDGWVVFNPDTGEVVATSDDPKCGVEKVARLDMP